MGMALCLPGDKALFDYICTNIGFMTKDIHEGRNIKRFREMMGIKQDALAAELGDDWSQKKSATCKV
jgi:hypothetical protein